MKPTFFRTPLEFRAWLEKRHREARELWVGFHKKSSGQASITWPEAVDEALCFGWIDGQRKGIDEVDHAIRFTPRKPGSIWSVANVKRVEQLLYLSEYKRRQAAPGVKITLRNFGRDRRYPITNRFRDHN